MPTEVENHGLHPIPYAWPEPMPRGTLFLFVFPLAEKPKALYHAFQGAVNKIQ
jgi:hypothetical protein